MAGIWGLPDSIVTSIRGHDATPGGDNQTPEDFLRDRAVFANKLCAIVELRETADQDAALASLAGIYGPALGIDTAFICRLFAAGIEKLADNAAILEFDFRASPYCRAAGFWLERVYSVEDRAAATQVLGDKAIAGVRS